MSEKILCGPCGYAEQNKNAEQWCTVCEEGLCTDCEKVHKSIKTSRNHWLISIEDFRQIQNITISLNCKDHDKRLELYCKTHDVALCLACVPSRHMRCSDVIPLEKAAENAKHSTALADLENTFTRALQNLQHIISDRESALDNFEIQKQTIKNTINDTRVKILKKIDYLEQKLLNELDTIHDNCKSETSTLLNQSKNAKRDLNRLREQTSQLKSFASEIQLFLATRQINESVFKKVESVKDGIKSVQNFEVHLHLNPTIMSLLDEEDQLGSISVKKTATSIPFKETNVGEAQLQLRVQNTKSIISIRIRLKKRFSVKHEGHKTILTGSTMLPNGNVLVASSSSEKNVILEYSEDGKYIRDIPCSRPPFDLTVIDTDRIAVTYSRYSSYIEILNIKNNTIEEEFELEEYCYGISYQDNTLIVITQDGIEIIDIGGNVLKTLNIHCGSYIETAKDRIYFAVDYAVHCISMAGDEIWVRTVEFLMNPWGIAVDDHQNVFVVDPDSNSMIVIQHDGKSDRTLLSETDGLDNPRSLHYNNEKKVLLLCDDNGCYLYALE